MTVPILKVFDLSIVDGQVYWFGYENCIVLFIFNITFFKRETIYQSIAYLFQTY